MLGEFRRYTWLVFGGPCKDVPILTEEIDELAFLFAVEVCTYDGVVTPTMRLYLPRVEARLRDITA